MRKLASIQKIAEIKSIEGADKIEAVRINGWWVVVQKDEFKVNDLVVYCEIDSWIPTSTAPFLSKGKEPREYNGVKGERLRTIKLRGQLSQGLIIPVPENMPIEVSTDLTDLLGIQKWEKPIPVQLQGQMRGNFPNFINKTDQERIQNLPEVFDDLMSEYEVSIKLDGSSMTVYFMEGKMGVCSRNIDLELDQENNTFVNVAKELFTGKYWEAIAIQGELMGPKIQGNRENLTDYKFFVFDIWDIDKQAYWEPKAVREFCEITGLDHVPVLHTSVSLNELGLKNIDDILTFAEGKSLHNPRREGVVFKQVDGTDSFKAILSLIYLKKS